MISCRNLSRRFGDKLAVDSVNFDLPDGAICALLGPNGAGKSTTLAMLSGLLAPTSGEAVVANTAAVPGSLELRRHIGVLPENLGLFDDLTVEEHLLLTGDMYAVTGNEVRRRMDQLLRLLDLDHGRHTFASACSHGMRKKTALATALLPQPRVLLLDEPFEGVDPVTARAMVSTLKQLSGRGVTTLMATHVLAAVEQVATDLMIMREGRIIWSAVSTEVGEPLESIYLSPLGAREGEEL
ncbi:MAG: ABC transporter ATP-binding protein, partial [Terriglobales bacterium]